MRDDDEILRSYEDELGESTPAPRSGRGFWIVLGALAVAGVILVQQIVANRPLVDRIGRTESSLELAREQAERIAASSGGYEEADANGLADAEDSLTFRGPDDASVGNRDLSVFSDADEWAAAALESAGSCFYIRIAPSGDIRYGAGVECTARAALTASEPRW